MKWKQEWIIFYLLTVVAVLILVHWGSKSVTVVSQNIPLERTHCIIIDAGHGGVDGGATSCTGIPESAYNLEIATCLKDLFQLLGYNTRMIRTTDISVYTAGESIAQKKISDLKERVRIVNETDSALLISIHQNTFSDSRYSGAQVFYAENGESQELARKLQTAFVSTLNPGSHRQCKKADGIYLMEHITQPGVLIECGFLSNPQEEADLRSREYQRKLCCVIAAITGSYLSNT